MRKLRMVQVGCGGRGQAHLAAIANSPDIELVALCEMDEAKLKETGQRYNISHLYTDMKAMIRDMDADLVSIITPPTLRSAIVEPALEAGARAILIEKPLALLPSEVRRLEILGRDQLIAINTQYAWMPHWQTFWPRLAAGEIGEILSISASTHCNILEQGPHIIALALEAARLGGLPEPEWVLAGGSGLEHFGSYPVPANTTAIIGLGAARFHLDCGLSAPPVSGEGAFYHNIQVEVVGSQGRFHTTLNKGWRLETTAGIESGPTNWPGDDQSGQPAFFESLRQTLLSDDSPPFSTRVEVAARQTDLMFACYASMIERRRVELPATLDDSVVERLSALA